MNATFELLKIKADLVEKENQHVIIENEVIDLLGTEFPEIGNYLERTGNSSNIYKAMQCFADFTKVLIRKRNFKEVKHCFIIAERMLHKGNRTVQNAIENCYLFSVSAVLDVVSPVSEKVKKLLTDSLRKEYLRQVCSGGI